MWEIDFWKATLERALKTFAQALLSALAVSGIDVNFNQGFDLTLSAINWSGVLSFTVLATLISVLTSIVSNMKTGTGPSIAGPEKIVPTPPPPPQVNP